MYWRPCSIRHLNRPACQTSLIGSTFLRLETYTFHDLMELEAAELWQLAPLTPRARGELPRHAFNAWHVRLWGEQRSCGLVVLFDLVPGGKWPSNFVVSTTPSRVIMAEEDRLLVLNGGSVQTCEGGLADGVRLLGTPMIDRMRQAGTDPISPADLNVFADP